MYARSLQRTLFFLTSIFMVLSHFSSQADKVFRFSQVRGPKMARNYANFIEENGHQQMVYVLRGGFVGVQRRYADKLPSLFIDYDADFWAQNPEGLC
jgi:hypothetical protein